MESEIRLVNHVLVEKQLNIVVVLLRISRKSSEAATGAVPKNFVVFVGKHLC